MANTANLKKVYAEQIAPALMKQFNYSSPMQIPVLKKIVVNQGLGDATQDKKMIEVAIKDIAQITGQQPVATMSKKDISNFHYRRKIHHPANIQYQHEPVIHFIKSKDIPDL